MLDLTVDNAWAEASNDTSSSIAAAIKQAIAPVTPISIDREVVRVAVTTTNGHTRSGRGLLCVCHGERVVQKRREGLKTVRGGLNTTVVGGF